MGRGQLKYRKRGGRGGGGTSRGGRAAGGRGSSSGSSESTAAVQTKRSGRRNDLTSHLPSNTEKWGRAFGEEPGEQGAGGGRRATSTSAVGIEETERLLDESEWAIGASSRHLAAAPQEDDEPTYGAAAAPGELLSLNLEVLEVCLRTLPIHERLRLPHALTAQLETQEPQGDGNPTPGPPAALPAREGGAAECARVAAAAGVGGVPEPVPGSTRGGDEKAGLGAPGHAAAAGASSPPFAAVGNDEGGVLDTLLGLPAATGPPAGAGAGVSWRASDGERSGAAGGGGEGVDVLFKSCDDDRVATGPSSRPGRKEEVVPAKPPPSSSSLSAQAGGSSSSNGRRESPGGAAALGGGVVGPDAGVDSGRGGGGTDELEDWLDGMLADA